MTIRLTPASAARPVFAAHGVAGTTLRRLTRDAGSLAFTEWLFIGVLGLAYLLSASTPLFGFQLSISFLKHVPLILLMPVLLLHFLGLLLNRHRLPWGEVTATTWPLVLLALFSLGGSLVARFVLGEDETFLVFGLYLLLLPVFALFPAARSDVPHWARTMNVVWIVAAVVALGGAAGHYGSFDDLHEIEYIVIAGFFVMYQWAESRSVKLLALALMGAAAFLNHKLTGFIIIALALMHVVVGAGWQRTGRQWRAMYGVMSVIGLVAVAGVLALLYFEFREYLPSGNTNVRMKQYEQAMIQFMESPIWGNGYTGGSGEVFKEFNRAMNIPTHSDMLDMLKHGGVIAFGLFLFGYLKLLIVLTRALAVVPATDRAVRAFLVSARFFLVSAALTFAINPLLLKGPYLIVIWGNAGLALGLSLALLRAHAAAEAAAALEAGPVPQPLRSGRPGHVPARMAMRAMPR